MGSIFASRIATCPVLQSHSDLYVLNQDAYDRVLKLYQANSSREASQKMDTALLTEDAVKSWLISTNASGRVIAVWAACNEAIEMDFSTFVEHYDDLWFPSSDDVIVASVDGSKLIELDHEEVFRFWNIKDSDELASGQK